MALLLHSGFKVIAYIPLPGGPCWTFWRGNLDLLGINDSIQYSNAKTYNRLFFGRLVDLFT
jgi:hypothetical protein